jgi:hypothetical protein
VPTVTLDWILQRVPPHIRIPYIKIDTEGADLLVVKQAGQWLWRAESVIIECQAVKPGGTGQHRQGGCTAKEAEAFFKSIGFAGGCPLAENQLENCYFGRDEATAKYARKFFDIWRDKMIPLCADEGFLPYGSC